ncbi:MAG: hypothetical protein ABIG44_00825 [Planctomycetota bacterium]
MTIQASTKAAGAALISDFIESGSFAWDQISACDYGVLDGSAACALMVWPGGGAGNWATWSTVNFTWNLQVRAFLRDTNNPCAVLTRVWDIQEAIIAVVLTGSNVNTLTRKALPVAIDAPMDTFYEFHGHDFIPVTVSVQIEEES